VNVRAWTDGGRRRAQAGAEPAGDHREAALRAGRVPGGRQGFIAVQPDGSKALVQVDDATDEAFIAEDPAVFGRLGPVL
jgi:hypothetical protein